MRFLQCIGGLVSAFLATGCGRSTTAPLAELPALADPTTFRAHAERLGCTMGALGFIGDEAFACVKALEPCGCTLVLEVNTARQRDGKYGVSLIKADLFGCPSGSGDAELRALLEPVVPARHLRAFDEIVTQPQQQRTPEQAQRFGAFQTARFDGVYVRSFFGVESPTPRRTIWLDRHTPEGIRELIVDAPAYGSCSPPVAPILVDGDVDSTRRRASEIPVGSCDRATGPERMPPCTLGDTRSRYHWDAWKAITRIHSDWRIAMRSVAGERMAHGDLRLDHRRQEALVSTLFALFPQDASGTSNAAGLTAAELAEQAVQLIPAPHDDAGFAAYLQGVADEWNDNIQSNLALLLDRDLELLVPALARTAHERTPQALEAAIRQALR
jgi:hypothetical protein